MRSRYTAYVLERPDYLLATWHPDTRPAQLDLVPVQKWLGLKILATEGGQLSDECGTVEFVARAKQNGRGIRLHEISTFSKVATRWFYVDGKFGPTHRA